MVRMQDMKVKAENPGQLTFHLFGGLLTAGIIQDLSEVTRRAQSMRLLRTVQRTAHGVQLLRIADNDECVATLKQSGWRRIELERFAALQ